MSLDKNESVRCVGCLFLFPVNDKDHDCHVIKQIKDGVNDCLRSIQYSFDERLARIESKYVTLDQFGELGKRVAMIGDHVKDIENHVRMLSQWAGGKLRVECNDISFHDYVGLVSGEAWKNKTTENEQIKMLRIENSNLREEMKELLSRLEGLEK